MLTITYNNRIKKLHDSTYDYLYHFVLQLKFEKRKKRDLIIVNPDEKTRQNFDKY